MNGVERGQNLDSQPGEAVDVEKATKKKHTRDEPPKGEPVMLPLQKGMQRFCLRLALLARAISLNATRDDRFRAVDGAQRGFESWCFRANKAAQPGVARREVENGLSHRLRLGPSVADDDAQNLAVALRRDGKLVLVIPRREAAFLCVV